MAERFVSEGGFDQALMSERIEPEKSNIMKSIVTKKTGFSLVEALAAVAILGIIAFLALPNIVAIKEDSEGNLAVARAEALNMAVASYIQSNGRFAADAGWDAAGTAQLKYDLISPYLAFAPQQIASYMPATYSINLPGDLNALSKTGLIGPAGTINY
jgi:prepilin-type N-terminal cleavage/methylation domain-containing protein